MFERGQSLIESPLISRACHRPQLNLREFSIRSNTIAELVHLYFGIRSEGCSA